MDQAAFLKSYFESDSAICILAPRYFRFMIRVAAPMAIRKENRMPAVGRMPKSSPSSPMTARAALPTAVLPEGCVSGATLQQ
jgi:hypothetical protein